MAISITNIGAQITIAIDGINHNYPVNSLTAEVVFNSNNTAILIKHFGNVVHVFENVANRVAVPANSGAANLVSQLTFFFNSPSGGGGLSTAENGLTANLTMVKLGGSLNQDTEINGGSSYNISLNALTSFIAQFEGVNGNGFIAGNDTQALMLFVDTLSAFGGDITLNGLIASLRHDIAASVSNNQGSLNIGAATATIIHDLEVLIGVLNGSLTINAASAILAHTVQISLNAPQVFIPSLGANKTVKTLAGGELVAVNEPIIQTQRLTSADFSTNSATFANTNQYILIDPAAAFGKSAINAVLNVFARTNALTATGEAILTESASSTGVFVNVAASLIAIPASPIPASDPYVLRTSANFSLPAAGGLYQIRVRRVAGTGGNVPQFRASEIRIIYS